jgi:hypothetical protein
MRVSLLAGLVAAMLSLGGCATTPRVALRDAHLVEGPVLIRRGEHHYLRYRFATPPSGSMQFAVFVDSRETDDAVYYYFVGAVQSTVLERGLPVERLLSGDHLEDLARRGRVFWLDPDGTTHPIATR